MDATTRISETTRICRRERERVTAVGHGNAIFSYGTSSASSLGCHSTDEPLLCREDFVTPTQVHPTAVDRGPSLFRRALVGSGVLALFALGLSMSSWRQQARNSAERDTLAAETTTTWQSADIPSLSVTAMNEYGEYDSAALALYGLEMVVEPHRQTTLSAVRRGSDSAASLHGSLFRWRLSGVAPATSFPARFDGNPQSDSLLKDADLALSAEGGPEIAVTIMTPGAYSLLVEELLENGDVIAKGAVAVTCKYVRREIRSLTDADREEFLDTMEAFYGLSDEGGRDKYGQDFFGYQRLTAYHNSARDKFCFHAGIQFLTAHASFNVLVERSLQAINPKVSLSFWDYMIDADTMGTEWADSTIFAEDMLGQAMGSEDDGFQLTEGRFGKIKNIYDPDNILVDSSIFETNHNAYGYIHATYNYEDVPLLSRAGSYCGLKANATIATAGVFFSCFDNDNLSDWATCMEHEVHGDMHGLLGGAFNCNVDMKQFHEEHPKYTAPLLSFVLEFFLVKYWPDNSFLSDYNDCDSECVKGQTEPCGCTCRVDAFQLSEEEIYDLTDDFMQAAQSRVNGKRFISYDGSSDHPWGFQQNGVRLDQASVMLLLRYIVKVGCEPGSVGAMCGGASPMDPIFWVMHPMFEKALHVLRLSPRYRDTYRFDWEDGSCSGSKLNDVLPFTEKSLGMGTREDFLTNAELMELLHPKNPRLPYVYERMETWGTRADGGLCPECAEVAAGNAGGVSP